MESGPIPHTAGGNGLRAVLAIRPPPSLACRQIRIRSYWTAAMRGCWDNLGYTSGILLKKQQQHPAFPSLQDHQGDNRGGGQGPSMAVLVPVTKENSEDSAGT